LFGARQQVATTLCPLKILNSSKSLILTAQSAKVHIALGVELISIKIKLAKNIREQTPFLKKINN
jgi:hypothetical protein